MKRILFLAEAVTLAQVVRLAALARALDPRRHEIHFASARFDELVFAGAPFVRHTIRSLSPELIAARVAGGRRLYSRRTLARYVAEDRALLRDVRPDLVVGDLRLSLAISAPAERVRHAALVNAYWSPQAVSDGYPLPDHPIVSLLGVERAARSFARALPFVFRHFARPVNSLRRAAGLPALGSLPEILTHGDYTLFPDVPSLVPTRALPPHQRYLGHVPWAPDVPRPEWWCRLDPRRPTVYVTLGSSGHVRRLPLVVEAAAAMDCQVLVATAGRARLGATPRNVFVADFLPGDLAARRAHVVVSNGGSTTGYQALAQGRPVLGVPFNMDQYLASQAIERAGAGLVVRAGAADAGAVTAALQRLLTEPAFAANARRVGGDLARADGRTAFVDFVAREVA
jgi:UDP:flavonoid glycosyltransferase YjiC (YdhE family)